MHPWGVNRRLTPKQERFVQALVSGASQREAYRAAYNCERSSDKTVDSKASRLLGKDTVGARYDEMMAELASRVLWDRERATREMLEVRELALEHIRATRDHKANMTDKNSRELADLPKTAVTLLISSTAELNKMFDVYGSVDGDDDNVTIVIDV